jgi:hypothetical protein
VTFPLPAQGAGIGASGSSLLRDADPAIFYALEFYAAILRRHVGPRLLAEAGAVGASEITEAVAETIPLNPEVFLTEHQVGFPLLCAYRKASSFKYIGQRKCAVDTIEVAYVLPPLTGGYAERLTPVLYAVAACIDNRTERGMDPAYTPSGGDAGGLVWTLAGVSRAEVKAVSYGGYSPTEKLFFPAVMLTLELQQMSDAATSDLDSFGGTTVHIDVPETDTTEEYQDLVEFLTPHILGTSALTSDDATSTAAGAVAVAGASSLTGDAAVLTSAGTVADVSVDPATLSLTGFWRNYTASPWTGTASAGASGGRAISAPTGPETPASTLYDGYGAATTDGVNDYLRDPTLAASSYWAQGAYTTLLVVRPSGGAAPNANAYADQQLFCASGDLVGISWTTSGVRAWHYNGTNWTPTGIVACSADAWHFIAVTYDGTTLSIAVDGGTPQTVARTNTISLAGAALRLARSGGAAYAAMQMLQVCTANTALSGATIEGIRQDAKARFPSAALP